MDQSFASCLVEIERSYLVLPKAARIRVERWVEKLASTGNNPIWRKHRNEYAKLLLNMIIARNLEAPFNVSPPEGTLPPFSSQYKAYNRNLLGPHESAFWRGLHEQLQEDNGSSFIIADITDNTNTTYASGLQEECKHRIGRNDSRSGLQQPLAKEIQSLNLLIREQSQKIKLLEQQLHDERTNHELQIQRLHYTNRMEVNNLKSQLEQFAIELSYKDLEISKVQERTFLNTSLDTSLHAPHSPGLSMRVRSALDNSRSRPAYSPIRRASSSPSPASRIPSTMNSGRRGLFSFLEQKNIISSPEGARGAAAFDISPSPQAQHRPSAHALSHMQTASTSPHPAHPSQQYRSADNYGQDQGQGQENQQVPGEKGEEQQAQEEESRFESPNAKDLSLHWGNNASSAVGDLEDEEFLAHIDRFQSEIKKINTNIAVTSGATNLF